DGHVAADLGDAAQCHHPQGTLAGLGRAGQPDRHVPALHGLDAAELGGRGLPPTATPAPAAAATSAALPAGALTAGVLATVLVVARRSALGARGRTLAAAARTAPGRVLVAAVLVGVALLGPARLAVVLLGLILFVVALAVS